MKKDFWKENGILVSLYGVVGVLVVTAGVLTINTLKPQEQELVHEENIQVQSSLVESYQEQIEKIKENDNNNEIEKLKESLKEDVKDNEIEKLKESLKEDVEDTEIENLKESLKEDNKEDLKEDTIKESKVEEKSIEEDMKEELDIESNEENKTSSIYEENFNETTEVSKVVEHELEKINKDTEDDEVPTKNEKTQEMEEIETSKLTWPIEGYIVMDFNDDVLVYDETLNLYRTNDSISIMANKGDEIVASANGKVLEIGSNMSDKGYIIIDHGNGYTTKYSQLLDNFVINKGDEVRRGQIIGHVGEPSNTTSRQGVHLEYTVAKDDVTVNPLQYLE